MIIQTSASSVIDIDTGASLIRRTCTFNIREKNFGAVLNTLVMFLNIHRSVEYDNIRERGYEKLLNYQRKFVLLSQNTSLPF